MILPASWDVVEMGKMLKIRSKIKAVHLSFLNEPVPCPDPLTQERNPH
jgi:hypothetical protein